MTNMLACVCQPTDVGIFRRSPIPLGTPLPSKGAIPKLNRTSQNSTVITTEPNIDQKSKSNKKSKHRINSNNVIVKRKTDQSENLDVLVGNSSGSSSSSLTESSSLSINNKLQSGASNVKLTSSENLFNSQISVARKSNSKETCPLVNTKFLIVTDLDDTTENVGSSKIPHKSLVVTKEDPSTLERSLKTTDDKISTSHPNDLEKLPEGVQLTLGELRDMACRQQAQIDSQHQLLAAKEQRLRYLKDQEARQQRVQAETERLRRLRDRVDAQELKLRKLRALRGQVDHHKQNNISLTSDLESIRALFNEKEKELSLAVAKVEELTRQLEELRRGRSRDQAPPASALELDKLRRELMYRNKLNEQQNQRLNQQREALTARQEEMSSIDKRISELQERLHRKRLLNQQLANQINAASNKAAYHQFVRLTGSTDQSNQFYGRKPQQINNQPSGLPRGNIATVEPYNHIPLPNSNQIRTQYGGNQENPTYHPVYQPNHHINNVKNESDQQNTHEQQIVQDTKKISNHYGPKIEENDALKEFSVSKSDPKYQTLPYNTKFTVSLISAKLNSKITENNDNNVNSNDTKDIEPIQHISTNGNIQSQHMTVHSAPLNVINKNIATPLNQNDLISRKNMEYVGAKEQNLNVHNSIMNNNQTLHLNGDIKSNFHHNTKPSDINVNHLPNNVTPNSSSYQKPISSVAPSVHHSGKLSNIYQTSSIKVQPVEPQTITNNKQLAAMPSSSHSSQSLTLSPPQANSTPIGTPEAVADKSRPALPPKPAIKPPPRQTQIIAENEPVLPPPPVPLTEPPSDDGKLLANQLLGINQRGTSQMPAASNQNKPIPFNQQQQQQQIISSNQKSTNQQMTNNQQIVFSTTQTNHIASINYQNAMQSPTIINQAVESMPIIKAKPLTIKKQSLNEQPKLRTVNSLSKMNGLITNNRRIEIPSAFHFSETNSEKLVDANQDPSKDKSTDELDKVTPEENDCIRDSEHVKEDIKHTNDNVTRRCKKGNLKQTGKANLSRRVSFDPLALLLDASLEGELELVKKTATQVPNPSAANDEGITALHNAICAGHFEIVKFLVEFGCDVNAQDSDGWTPLHCAASCNNVAMVKFLVEHGACIFATTLSDHETAAEKCEEDEEGFDGCSEYLYSVQEKLGILSGGVVYAVFDYIAQQPDELSFKAGQQLTILRKGDESEREWWWSRLDDKEGYVPRNLLGLYPRVSPQED